MKLKKHLFGKTKIKKLKDSNKEGTWLDIYAQRMTHYK